MRTLNIHTHARQINGHISNIRTHARTYKRIYTETDMHMLLLRITCDTEHNNNENKETMKFIDAMTELSIFF